MFPCLIGRPQGPVTERPTFCLSYCDRILGQCQEGLPLNRGISTTSKGRSLVVVQPDQGTY